MDLLIMMIVIWVLFVATLICFKAVVMGLELAQPAAYVITAAITLPVTVAFLSKLPQDGEEAQRKR